MNESDLPDDDDGVVMVVSSMNESDLPGDGDGVVMLGGLMGL